MDPEDYDEDDLGIYCVPINDAPAADDDGRSLRIGQQRGDYNISPPTIPRTNSADIFSGSAFASAAGQIQSFTPSRLHPIPQNHHVVAGQIPSYQQERELSSHQENAPSNLRWQSRIIPQSQYQASGPGTNRHFFTPLHSSSNEESKFSAVNNSNPISPVGVTSPGLVNFTSPGLVNFTSPGLVNFTSPIHQRLERQIEQTGTPNYLSSPPASAMAAASAAQNLRPASVNTIGTSVSNDSLDSESRGRQRRKRRTATAQRKVKTPGSQDTPRRERNEPESKSPPPQNLRGDPFRSAKVKTELCRHYNTPRGCPFGDKCNYAHGEHELKYTKLMDLERAGLVDVEIFRTHPCPTWVATGAW